MLASNNRSFAITIGLLVAVISLQSCAIQNDEDREETPSLCLTAAFTTEATPADDPVAEAIAAEGDGAPSAGPDLARLAEAPRQDALAPNSSVPLPVALSTAGHFPVAARDERLSPGPGEERWITVRFGETLWGIARDHDVDIKTVMELNELSTSKLRPGQRLRLR